MRQNLFFDIDRKCYIREEDLVLYHRHIKDASGPFIHPLGFPIFLSISQLGRYDEYAIQDPYGVHETISSEFHKRRISMTVELVKKVASSQSKILDLGCGEGYITHEISMSFPDIRAVICGLDYSLTAIETAKSKFPDIEFCVADACSSLPFSEGYFDIAVCNNLWEHVEVPLVLLKQIWHILKDNGFLIISTPSRYRLINLSRVIRGKPILFVSKHHVTEYSVGQMIEMLSHGKFDVIDITSRPFSKNRRIFETFFQRLIQKTGSHHRLESTVFFLAQKKLMDVFPHNIKN